MKPHSLLLALYLLFLAIQPTCAAQKRIALVIGNSAYNDAPLKNPANDASDMAVKLTKLGFQVHKLINANARAMKKAISRFGKKLHQEDTIGLFYFAGHGVQVKGNNYLLPIGTQIESEADIEYEAVNAGRILSQMSEADNGLNMVVLDACRNNPFARSFRSSTRGLARMEAPRGSLILYATSPGDVAADGTGRNGLFTEKLMQTMEKKGLKIEDVFKQTAIAVSRESKKQQIPYIEGVILGDFYFTGPVTVNQSNVQLADQIPISSKARQENIFWNSVEKIPSIEGYMTYIQQYPNGHYASIAKYKIKQLQAQKKLTGLDDTIRKQAKLTIRSNVKGDTVTINGEDMGSSTLEIQLKPGIYEFEVSKSGYQTWERSIQIKAGHDQVMYAKLKKILKIKQIQTQNYVNTDSLEWNIDRQGLDFKSFNLSKSDPGLCQNKCINNPKCKAWTYVKPNTLQGPKPRCWIKYAVPKATFNTCCVSGVK